ncbi:CHAT domain-containing protein [Suillus subalutaceus]|uniref:CHAT domain-containing protein n=1 Tax=Suillus subalutaceus TaxID=48586 RepID=UPI001B87692A|nr:CHAT domain-containing protein [Suillus subalutaceus]KAG1832311.1 CHAT domain-containing protein [Suillus subalutaceus]
MPGSWEGQYIRLELIRVNNLPLPSRRIHTGFYVSIHVDSRYWRSPVRVVSSYKSDVLGDIVILSLHEVCELLVEIRVSYEFGRMLGDREVVAKFETSWDKLLDRGDEPFGQHLVDISFPPHCGDHSSLTLKAAILHPCDNQYSTLLDSIVECEIARDTDAGHEQLATYVISKTVYHLNNAVQHFQLVMDSLLDPAAALTNFAWVHLKGYIPNDLQDIISFTSLFCQVLALHLQGYPDHPLSIHHFLIALICKLLPLCPEGTYLRSIAAGVCSVDYVIRACNSLPIDASDEGIHLRRIVLEICPLGNDHRPKALGNLAQALGSRFEQCGSIDDLDECIRRRREAVSLCCEGHSERHTYLDNLALSLTSRFDYQGNSRDLNEAISLHEETLRLRPVGHEYRDFSLDNLGIALCTRVIQRDNVNDIIRAISLQREALTLRPPGNPYRGYTLNNLAGVLATRYEKSDASEDLNEAIDLYRDSLQLQQYGHSNRPTALRNLSLVLCSRFTQTQKHEDIKEAIRLCQESFASLPQLHPNRYYSYSTLRAAYMSRYEIQHHPTDLSLAVENFRLASRHPTHGFPSRIIEAYNWTVAGEQHGHGSTLEAYSTFFELLDDHLATRSSTLSRREAAAVFHYARSLPVDAASCVIRSDNLRHAVELVEQGRGQQWSLASRLRTPLEDLESMNPNIAHKFSELSRHLADAQGCADSVDRAATDRAAVEYRRIMTQWEAAVAEIHNLPRFLAVPTPTFIRRLASGSASWPREPHHVSLPSITLTDLNILKDRFARAIRLASRMDPAKPRTDLIVLLRIVWDQIMLPIVNVLENVLKLKRRSRIWLCPTAAFTSIPLHAAHPFQTKADGSGKEPCLEDLYICSYTPKLSALIRSRQMMKQRVPPSFVAIGQGQPGAGKGKALLAVDSELEFVRKLVPATANGTTISGDVATRWDALEALQLNTWVHLACHGKQDPAQPYNSHFVMRDQPLTLLDIMDRDIPYAEFAFLSACHTAVGDKETPDEVIHLAAGLQFSGFKSVIGTLWEVDDAVAKHVVKAFYENLFGDLEDGGVMDCTKAAWALNRATHAVKTKVPLEQRMVFIHIGV